MAETLTAIRAGLNPADIHRAACPQAWWITQEPIDTIRPVSSAIGINKNGVSTLKNRVIIFLFVIHHLGGPTIRKDQRGDSRHLCQALLQEQATGAEFVGAGSMAWASRHQHDFFIGGATAKRAAYQTQK